MAASYDFHRKLIEDPSFCSTQCHPIQTLNPNCTLLCSQFCPNLCNTTTTTLPPLSPPSTADYYIPTTPPKHHHSSLSLPLKISLVILVLTFSLFLLYTLYKFYTVWYRSRSRRHPPPSPLSPAAGNEETLGEFVDSDVLDHPIWYIRTIGLQPSVISAITVVKYSKSDGLIEGTDCSVCLSDFEPDEMLRLLPKCNHAFHISCIDTWLRSHTNCPLCRAGIVKNNAISTTNNSASSDQNLDDSGGGQIEETLLEVSISNSDEVHGEDDDQGSELRIGVIDEEDLNENNNDGNNNKGELVVGGGGTSDFLIIRRSVSLNDYAGCRVRSDVNNNNNCYYSDRHQVQVQIQPIEGDWELNRRDLEMI